MKKIFPASVLALALTLGACSAQPDFKDEAQKQEIFDAYVCKETLEASESRKSTYASEAATEVLADENASDEDQKVALRVTMAAMGHDAGYEGPPLTTSPDGESCYGWVWDHYAEKRRSSDEYENFTWEQAENAGVIEYGG